MNMADEDQTIIESNEPIDATPSWSGYCYQGKVAILHSIKLINHLLTKGETFDQFAVEIEWVEDFAILKGEEYLSIHQVKAKRDDKAKNHRFAIMNLLSRLLQNITPKDLTPIAEEAWGNYLQKHHNARKEFVTIVFDTLDAKGFLVTGKKLAKKEHFSVQVFDGLQIPDEIKNDLEALILDLREGDSLPVKELLRIRDIHLPLQRKNKFKTRFVRVVYQDLMNHRKISPAGAYLSQVDTAEKWLEELPFITNKAFTNRYEEIWDRIRIPQAHFDNTIAVLHTLVAITDLSTEPFDFLPDGLEECLDRFRQDAADCVAQDQIDDEIKQAICWYYQTLNSPEHKLEASFLDAALLALCGMIDNHVASRHIWRQDHPGQQTPSDVRRIPFAEFKNVLSRDFQEWSDSRWARLLRNVFEHALESYLESEHRRDTLDRYLSQEQIADQNERLIEYLENAVMGQYRETRFLDFCQLINPDRNISESDEEKTSALNITGLENVFFRFFASIEQSFSHSGPMILKANDSVILPSLIVDDNERRVALRVWDDFCVPEIGYEIEELVTQFIDIEDLEAFVRKIKDVGDEDEDGQVHRSDTHLMKRKPTKIVSIKNAIDELTP